VNDATNYVLGWSLENKIKALTADFEKAEDTAAKAGKQAGEAEAQVKRLTAKLAAIDAVMAFGLYEEIDVLTVQAEVSRLLQEKQKLEASSSTVKTLREQLKAIRDRLAMNEEDNNRLQKN